MDFFTGLPPELLVQILTYLPVQDVVRCECVCKRWRLLIQSLVTYWKLELKRMGVPPAMYSTGKTGDDSFRELALRTWKGRELIHSVHPRVVHLSASYLSASYFQCHYVRFNSLVGTTYANFVPVATVVAVIQPGSCLLKTVAKFQPVQPGPKGRVVWASIFAGYLLLVSASGRWQGHRLASRTVMLDWQGETLYDPQVMISCCRQCFLVATVKLITSHKAKQSYWDVRLLRLGRGQVSPSQRAFQVVMPFSISPLSATNSWKGVEVLSRTTDVDGEQFCCCHWLLIQWAGHVFVHEVGMSACPTKNPIAVLSSTDCENLVVPNKSQSTSFVISADGLLLGLVFRDKLCVWNLSSLEQDVAVPIPRRDPDTCAVSLIALGHMYSLLGYESREGRLQVVATHTGDVIFSTHRFSGQGSSQGRGLPPPYFTFLGPVDEFWLSSVDEGPHPSLPSLLFWDKHWHCVSGIVLGKKSVLQT